MPRPRHADPFTRAWPNTIAICGIMKDERWQDVHEWISYHRFVGVDKFYLRENGNSSSIEADLQPYVEAGIVDFGLVDGPKHPTQTNWYNRCSNLAQPQHSWVAFIDLDEFIVVLNSSSVSMQWVLFGAAGHKTPPTEGQLGGFNRCTGTLSKQMKCLGSSFWFHDHVTFRPTHVHQCNFRLGAASVLGNLEPLNMWRVDMAPGSGQPGPYGASHAAHLSEGDHRRFTNITLDHQLVLFHYVTRAQDDFVSRKILRRSGVYATEFAQIAAGLPAGASIDAQYAAFEHEHGFDGAHAVCEQGARLADAITEARAAGWSELLHGDA